MSQRTGTLAKISYGMDQLRLHASHPSCLADIMLTFKDATFSSLECSRRWRSFQTNVLRHLFPRGLRIVARSKNHRIHIHCCVDTGLDITTGFDWEAFFLANDIRTQYRLTPVRSLLSDYKKAVQAYKSSMNKHLKELWRTLRSRAAKYGFGHLKILPVRTSIQALKYYYFSNIPKRRPAYDRGLHYCAAWGMELPKSGSFKTLTTAYRNYTIALRDFCTYVGLTSDDYRDVLRAILGPNWHWKVGDLIKASPDPSSEDLDRMDELRDKIAIHRQILLDPKL